MLLTISTEHKPATDLGFLLHKHPERFQSFDLSFGQAHVFYPEATEDRCTACLLLDVDPVGMVLLRELLQDRQFEQIVGMDVSIRSLEMAQKRLKLDRLPDRQAEG